MSIRGRTIRSVIAQICEILQSVRSTFVVRLVAHSFAWGGGASVTQDSAPMWRGETAGKQLQTGMVDVVCCMSFTRANNIDVQCVVTCCTPLSSVDVLSHSDQSVDPPPSKGRGRPSQCLCGSAVGLAGLCLGAFCVLSLECTPSVGKIDTCSNN